MKQELRGTDHAMKVVWGRDSNRLPIRKTARSINQGYEWNRFLEFLVGWVF